MHKNPQSVDKDWKNNYCGKKTKELIRTRNFDCRFHLKKKYLWFLFLFNGIIKHSKFQLGENDSIGWKRISKIAAGLIVNIIIAAFEQKSLVIRNQNPYTLYVIVNHVKEKETKILDCNVYNIRLAFGIFKITCKFSR